MTITREQIESRLADLARTEKELWGQLNACLGAQQELRCWLDVLAAPAPPHDKGDAATEGVAGTIGTQGGAE